MADLEGYRRLEIRVEGNLDDIIREGGAESLHGIRFEFRADDDLNDGV